MKRRWLVGGVLGLVVLVAATLAIVVPPKRLPGEAIAMDPAGAATEALDQLAGLRDIHLTGSVAAESGQRLDVDIVVLGGDAQAVVRDDAGGTAEFVVRDGKAAVRANAAWWRNTVPVYVQDYSDKWVKADDSAGFPATDLTALTGDKLEQRLAGRRSDWTATPALFGDGQRAMALTRGETGWTVYVSPTSPPRLLGLGGPVLGTPDRLARDQATGYPNGLLSTAKPDGPCRKRAGEQLDETAPDIASLPEPAVPDVDERPALQAQVLAPGGVCMTPACPFTVMVTNAGNGAGAGMVLITSSSGPPMTAPLELPPGGEFSTVYNAPNPAPPSPNGRVTVPIFVEAFAQVTSLAGPDIDAGKRLHDRGIDPDNPLPGNPGAVGPDVTKILDLLTGNVPGQGLAYQPDGDAIIKTAKDMLGKALSSRLLDTLETLVTSPALRYGDDVSRSPLPDLITKAATGSPDERVQARRTLDLLKHLVEGRPPPATPDQAPVHVEDGLVYDDAAKIVYRPAVVTRGAPQLVDVLGAAASDLDQAQVPQGFSTVIQLYVEGTSNLSRLSQTQFRDQLRTARSQGRSVADVVLDGSGTPLVSGLTVVSQGSEAPDKGGANGVFGYDVNALAALGQTKAAHAPAIPPPDVKPHFTPYSRQHTLGGDPYEPAARQDAGGHRSGTGSPGKTEFPKNWVDEYIEQSVLELVDRAIDNANNGTTYPPGTAQATEISAPRGNRNQMRVPVWGWTIRGTANGIEMEVTMLQDGTLMAYPTGNYADKNGNLVPSPNDPKRVDLPYLNPGGAGSPIKPPADPKATLPTADGKTEQVPLNRTGRTVWLRDTREWRTPGVAKPSSGPAVNVTVTTNENGKKARTEKRPTNQAPPPAPAAC